MSHSHSRECPEKQSGVLKLVLLVSLLYMVFEVVGGILSGSLALIADAGHMLIDSLSIALGLFALWLSQRPASATRTFGYQRAEILAALLNGSTLIVVSFYIFYEAWLRIHLPTSIRGELMVGVATGGLVVNLFSLLVLRRHHSFGVNMRGVWLHALMDTLGSVSALVAGLFVTRWGWTLADPIVSCLIALLILQGAWKLVTECVDVLLESVPKGIETDKIRKAICSLKGVDGVHDLHVWTVKSGTFSLSAHVKITELSEQTRLLTEITGMLEREFHIFHSTIQLECGGFEHRIDAFKDCHLGNS